MLPAIISQFVTVIKDTSLLYSVIALQEPLGSAQILMGRYFEAEQVFTLYLLVAAIYFLINFRHFQLPRASYPNAGLKLRISSSDTDQLSKSWVY